MKLNITAKFTKKEIEKHINDWLDKVDDAILLMLQQVGETFVTNARANGAYTDRTGNLRSSIGYVILKNGFQYFGGDFVLVREGQEGIKIGKKRLNELIAEFKQHRGWVLIGIAGMHYASAVEAKGKDVITGSSLIAISELKAAMKRIREKL